MGLGRAIDAHNYSPAAAVKSLRITGKDHDGTCTSQRNLMADRSQVLPGPSVYPVSPYDHQCRVLRDTQQCVDDFTAVNG